MIDPVTKELLHQIIRRESRSLFQYVREVPMWVGTIDRPVLARLRDMASAEERSAPKSPEERLPPKGEVASPARLDEAAFAHELELVDRGAPPEAAPLPSPSPDPSGAASAGENQSGASSQARIPSGAGQERSQSARSSGLAGTPRRLPRSAWCSA